MKYFRKLVVLVLVLAIALAFSISANAMNFNVEESYNSIFVIMSGNSLGSGFAFGQNCIITNAHVISNPSDVSIETYNGNNNEAFVVAIDEDLDIAILGIKGVTFTPLVPADYLKMSIGDDVYAVGAPNSMAYSLTKGCLSAKERQVGMHAFIQTDAAINSGNSGGPLLNDAGNIIGVNSYKMSDAEGIGLAIPISVVTDFLNSNNITTDDNGNVGTVLQETSQYTNNARPESLPSKPDTKASVNVALLIGMLISILLNIFLIVIIVFQKRKILSMAKNSAERTDFDIDILE